MGVDETGNVIPTKVAILEEVIDNNELFINKVTDPDMIVRLTRILKNTLNQLDRNILIYYNIHMEVVK